MDHENNDNSKNIKRSKQLSERYLKNSGQYYLNRFPASSAHFLKVMSRKIDRSCHDHPDQNRQEWINHVQETLVPYFQKLGFINDDLYANALLNSLKNKGLSTSKIKSKMIEKSISKDLIDKLMNDGMDDITYVHIFARKRKIGTYRPFPYDNDKDKQRDLGKLARAGFSYTIALSVFEP